MAGAQVVVRGSNGGNLSMDGVTVVVNTSGYPIADPTGIAAAMQGTDGYSIIYTAPTATGTAEFRPTNGGNATCYARYTANTGTVTVSSTGCV